MPLYDDPFDTGNEPRPPRPPAPGVTAPVQTLPYPGGTPAVPPPAGAPTYGRPARPTYGGQPGRPPYPAGPGSYPGLPGGQPMTYPNGVPTLPGQGTPLTPPTPQPTAPAPFAWNNLGAQDGFDWGKLNDPTKQTIKYRAARVFNNFNAGEYRRDPSAVLAALRSAGLTATQVGDDKIDFQDGFGPVDVVTGGGRWWWGAQDPNAPAQGAHGGPSSSNTLNTLLAAMAQQPAPQVPMMNWGSLFGSPRPSSPPATVYAPPYQAPASGPPAPTFSGGYVQDQNAQASPVSEAIRLLSMQTPQMLQGGAPPDALMRQIMQIIAAQGTV